MSPPESLDFPAGSGDVPSEPSWHDDGKLYDDGYTLSLADRHIDPDHQGPHMNGAAQGTYAYDLCCRETSGDFRFNKRWPSIEIFEIWRRREEAAKAIEFKRKERKALKGAATTGIIRITLVCGRDKSGGTSQYVKKNPERKRKAESKIVRI